MTTLEQHGTHSQHSPSPSPTLSTSWMPLDGLVEQWGQFGAEAVTAPALHATSAAFAALARETEALEHHMAASWDTSQVVDVTDLEHALDQLSQAREHWTEAILSLELLARDVHSPQTSQETMRLLVMETMEQRVRLSMLLYEVEREHLLAYRLLPASSQREEARR